MYASNSTSKYDATARLIKGLADIPQDWQLVPLNGKKQPIGDEWQKRPFTPKLMGEIILRGVTLPIQGQDKKVYSNQIKGYGILTGTAIIRGASTFYLMALDLDGPSALALMLELSNGEELPPTVSFTSGRPGRSQHLFLVPEQYIDAVKTTKYKTGATGDDGKPELVEFRFANCQSVLPPSVHPITGEYKWISGCSPKEIEVAIAPMWVIEKMLVSRQPEQQPQLSRDHTIHQEQWTDIDYALSYLSALSPSRADDYDDWRSVGMALKSVDETLLSLWDNWSRQSSKYKAGECEKKWNSFKSSGIKIATLAHFAIQDGWKSPFKKAELHPSRALNTICGVSDDGENNVVIHPRFTPLGEQQLLDEIEKLINSEPSNSHLSARINELAKRARLSAKDVWSIYRERIIEVEAKENRQDTASELEKIIKAKNAQLNLHDLLPEHLANAFINYSDWLNVRPESSLLIFLSAIGGVQNSATDCTLNFDWDFRVSPNLFFAIVAPPGQKKSPILKTIARKPLRLLNKEEKEDEDLRMKDYESEKEIYDGLSKEEKASQFPEGEPQPPERRKLFCFDKATGEGLRNQIQAHPNQGMVLIPDEMAGLLKSANQYRSGKGSDEEDLLSFYDGTGETVLRASGIVADYDKVLLSIVSTIQPGVLQKHIQNCSDENGKWARFLFVNQPRTASTMSEDGGSFDLTPLLTGFYKGAASLPAMNYKLEAEAFKYFCKIYNRIERMSLEETHPGLAAAWAKVSGRIGKLAINLHIIHELAQGKKPNQFIPLARIVEATKIAYFGMNQVYALYTELGDSQSSASHLVKILELSQKRGQITARDVQHLYKKDNRPSPIQIRQWFVELENMGKGTTTGSGRSLSFNCGTVCGTVEQNVEPSSTIETTIYQGLESESGTCGTCGTFPPFLENAPFLEKTNFETDQDLEKTNMKVPQVPQSPQMDDEPVDTSTSVVEQNVEHFFVSSTTVPQRGSTESSTESSTDDSTESSSFPKPYEVGQLIEVVHSLSPYIGVVIKITKVQVSLVGVNYVGMLQRARRREDRKREQWMLSHDEVKLVLF